MPEETREGCGPAEGAAGDGAEAAELTPTGLLSLEHALSRSGTAESLEARAARLEADRQIMTILRHDGFAGPRYEKVVGRLMDCAWRTMVKWTGTGEIFTRSRLAGRPIPADKITTEWTQDDRYQIATDSVIGGLTLFHKYGLVQGRWNPSGGASLTTYFVGATVRAFRPVHLRWMRTQQTAQAELARPPGHDESGQMQGEIPDQRATDPYYAAALHDQLARALPHITDLQVREGLGWRAMGYTQAEAADRVGLTPKALERRIGRVRVRIVANLARQLEPGEGGAR